MTREEVLQESQKINSGRYYPDADEVGMFVFKWGIYKGISITKLSPFIKRAKITGDIVPLYLSALEMAEKEFSINKLYTAPDPRMPQNQARRLLLIF